MGDSSNSNAIDIKRLSEIISSGGIFIWDKSALCSVGFKKCVQNIFSIIRDHNDEFIVPEFVKESLTRPEGEPALMVIDKGFFTVQRGIGSYDEMMEYIKRSGNSKLNIFINDGETRIQLIKSGKSAGVFSYFYTISEDGEILTFRNAGRNKNSADTNAGERKTRYSKTEKGFQIKAKPEQIEYRPIMVSRKKSVGDILVGSDGMQYRLARQEIVNNGAITYSTDKDGVWIKVFNSKSLNTYLKAKIERMKTYPLKFEGLCWPLDIVCDLDGNFRGYTLDSYQGIPLHLCIFKRAGIDTYFPDWTKVDLCVLTETILKKIEFLHKKNVLFGCINPAAIRVVNQTEVYFTDTDNYQIDGFPSTVHNISFTAPELLDKKIYLATKQNENFAIAELVFMLMMPGKTPYAVGTDEAPETLIKKMRFPYSNGQIHGNYALPGMWRFMWSHLSSLKGCFYNIFQDGAKYNKPENRQDAFYWEKSIGYYKKDLLSPDDEESLKIYPRTFKRGGNETFYRCNYCGVEHPRFYFFNKYFDDYRICNSCIDKMSDVSFTCKACGKTYYYTNRTALFHKTMKKQDTEWKDQKYCRDCKKKTISCIVCGKEWPFYRLRDGRCPECNQEYRESTYKWIKCVECGRTFEFTVKDHEFYLKKGLNEPRRCQDCRNRHKNGGFFGGGLFRF